VHGYLHDADVEEPELLQPRGQKGGSGINLGKIAGDKACESQHGRDAERRQCQQVPPLSSLGNVLLKVI
jgi:hypothetical protein